MRNGHEGLTRRELEILTLVAAGLSDKLIGDRLAIARSTTSNHVTDPAPVSRTACFLTIMPHRRPLCTGVRSPRD